MGPWDIDMNDWLGGVGFHPADTERKQRGHELARLMTAAYAMHLHQLLPPGRDKSIAFTHLEDVFMRANRALAVGEGPRDGVELESSADGSRAGLRRMVQEFKNILADLEAVVPYDPRIHEYEAEQRGEVLADPAAPVLPFEYRTGEEGSLVRSLVASMTATAGPKAEFLVAVDEHDEGENHSQRSDVYVDDPEVLEGFASYLLSAANQLRALQARPEVSEYNKTPDPL